jgi:L-alanine-DL-glutamate epimerase-like enolase superfamily enzyme
MPNQLAPYKRRQSLAEHSAVLAVLAKIARDENVPVMALLRQATRDLIRSRVTALPAKALELRATAWLERPRMPVRFKTPAKVARFKKEQREFDRVILDLGLASPASIQDRNSIVSSSQAIKLIDFDRSHAASI